MKLFIPNIQEDFISSCRAGNMQKIKYYLTTDKLLNHADINQKGDALFAACISGKLEVAQYLLSSPDLREHADILYRSEFSNYSFNMACAMGALDIVQFMLESPLIKTHAIMSGNALRKACLNNQVYIIEYFHSKFSLQHYFDQSTLKVITDMCNENLLKFLIQHCGIKTNKEIEEFLSSPYAAPQIQYINGESNYLKCELFKKKALNMFKC